MNTPVKLLTTGQIFPTKDGGSVTVIKIDSYQSIHVRHNDQHGYTRIVGLSHLNAGTLKNPYLPTVFNVGYIGDGPHKPTINRRITPVYSIWSGMLNRCYSSVVSAKNLSYINAHVHPVWHNFQNFAEWYTTHPFNYPGHQLDKDILYEGNMCYGPHTCTLVPVAVNNIFTEKGRKRALQNSDLPQGVHRNHNKFQADLNGVYLGNYNTAEEASAVYRYHKYHYICDFAHHYHLSVCDDVLLAIYELAESYL